MIKETSLITKFKSHTKLNIFHFNFTEFINSRQSSKHDDILVAESTETVPSTFHSETTCDKDATPTFDFLLEFTIQNENNLLYQDTLHWDLKIFYPSLKSNDLKIIYDDVRDSDELKLRTVWKANNSIERGKWLRLFLFCITIFFSITMFSL